MSEGSPPGAGRRFGRYELRFLLGRGAMGEVYAAYDTVKDRTVALKLLPPDLAGDPAYQERFRREARTAARLQEPHVIPIHDFGQIDGTLFIDMRLVDGRDLKSVLATGGAMRPEYAVQIIRQVASALDAAHADGLVHRDVKPANILVTPAGFAYLADFGIARRGAEQRMTEEGSALGSLPYMAPERFGNEPATPQADVYALACVLFECLTGRVPFGGEDVASLIAAHLHAPVPSVRGFGAPAAFDDVLSLGLAKSPGDRFRTARALSNAAEEALRSAGDATVDARTLGGRDPSLMRTVAVVHEPSGPVSPYPMPVADATPTAAAPVRRGGRSLWLVSAAVAVLAAVIVALWVVGRPFGRSTSPPADAATGQTSAPSATPSGTAPSTQPTTASPTSTPTPSATPTSQATIAAGAGYDWQGWDDPRGRCHVDDRAMLVAGSQRFRTVVCQTAAGRYYYRGFGRSADDAGIEIDDPWRVSGGWEALNKDTTYELTPRSITIVSPSGHQDQDATTTWAQVTE